MMLDFEVDPAVVDLAVALVEAQEVQIGVAPPALKDYGHEVVRRVVAEGLQGGDERRGAVRQLLRHGGFKPAGRSKPAQEYLLRTVTQEGGLPGICNVVDLINAVSLDSGLPISLVALDRIGQILCLRYGAAGERYVFNPTGQELDVTGLLSICSGQRASSTPQGSPVKDSMEAKVTSEDRHVLACIYAPASRVTTVELGNWAERLEVGFVQWCAARQAESRLLASPQ